MRPEPLRVLTKIWGRRKLSSLDLRGPSHVRRMETRARLGEGLLIAFPTNLTGGSARILAASFLRARNHTTLESHNTMSKCSHLCQHERGYQIRPATLTCFPSCFKISYHSGLPRMDSLRHA